MEEGSSVEVSPLTQWQDTVFLCSRIGYSFGGDEGGEKETWWRLVMRARIELGVAVANFDRSKEADEKKEKTGNSGRRSGKTHKGSEALTKGPTVNSLILSAENAVQLQQRAHATALDITCTTGNGEEWKEIS